jgi:plasmid stabilization system protein ParE
VKYEIRAGAARDLDEAATRYRENARDERLPVRFLLEVRAAFEAIVEAPLACPVVHGDIRRYRVLTFPTYSVFYRVLADVVVITAVFHGRRHPEAWKHRG